MNDTDIDNKTSHPHDAFFKASLADIDIAQGLLQKALPEDILEKTDFSTLKHEKTNFIDSVIGKKEVDVLFSANIAGENGYIYCLAEHQSSVDYHMSFRLLKYACAIYDYHKAKRPKDKYFPLVYSFVIYNGKAKYTAPLDFFALFKYPELAKDLFIRPYHLIDLPRLSDEALWEFNEAKLMLYMLKHIFDEDLLIALEKIVDDLQESANRKFLYLKTIFEYSVSKGQTEKTDELVKLFTNITPDEKKEDIMTIAENLIKKGEARGEARGEQKKGLEIAVNLHNMGNSVETIAKATGLTLQMVKDAISKAESGKKVVKSNKQFEFEKIQ